MRNMNTVNEENAGDSAISKSRLEALVDGVFAFAMTLLVVGLSIPAIPKADAATELPTYLATMYPQFLSFIIAFFILAAFWVVHHEQFHFLRTVNKIVLWINFLILIFVVLVPFSTNLSGEYSHVPIAPLVFHVNLLALGILFFFQWQYIAHCPDLVKGPINPVHVVDSLMQRSSTILAAASGILLIFLNAPFSTMYLYMIFPIIMRILVWYRHSKWAKMNYRVT